jgi:hydrogenase maturation protease
VSDVLVIGYGNPLRGDDGIGPAVAEGVAALGLPRVRTIAAHQLTPELAADLTDAKLVIFVDAAVGTDPVAAVRLDGPATTPSALTHAVDPRGLVALARAVYGQAPEAWLVTAAGSDFDFRNGLSATGRENAREAMGYVKSILRESSNA